MSGYGHESIWCPVCGKIVWTHSLEPFKARASVSTRSDPSGVMLAMVQAAIADKEETRRRAELAVSEHMELEHAFRLWLARTLRTNRPLRKRWPWSRNPEAEEFRVSMKEVE